jgi:hypothetical protein
VGTVELTFLDEITGTSLGCKLGSNFIVHPSHSTYA